MMYQERDSADPVTYGGVTASSDIDIRNRMEATNTCPRGSPQLACCPVGEPEYDHPVGISR